jgi:PAS domain S-box-containing protein
VKIVSLRRRVVSAFLVLIALSIIEVALVIYVQREAQRALSEAERTQSISDGTSARVRGRVNRATLVLTIVPISAVAVMIAMMVATRRNILTPLASLATSARKLAAGDYTARTPPTRADEIGALVSAFDEMRSAVSLRALEAALAHQETREAHGELLAIINTVPAALVIMDPDGSIRLQNRAAEHLLGPAPATAAERKAYWERFTIRDGSGKSVPVRELAPLRALRGDEIIGEELEVNRPDNRSTIILVSAAPLTDEQGHITGVAAAFQDITRLRELDRMKDDFVSVVSHELRTPLTAIRGSLQLLLADELSVPNPDDRELLEVGLKSCDRLVRIINDILDISKIEAGQLKLNRRPLAVNEIVQHSVDGVQQIAMENDVRFIVDVPRTLSPVMGDADRLTQALVNLLSNAVKFAPPHSVVNVAAREEGAFVLLSVQDYGHGIAPEDLSRLFGKFQQLDGTAARRKGGTGLGLTITKAIIEEHGGHVTVDSTVGEGTTFTMAVPRGEGAAEAWQPKSAAASVASASPPDAAERTVLVVDDDSSVRLMVRRALEMMNHKVIEAASGREAVERAKRDRPDAITLDLMMPDKDGWWVLEQLRADSETASIPVVVVTGTDTDQLATIHPVLRKPFDTLALIDNVSDLLRGRRGATVLLADDDAEIRRVLREALQRQGFTVIEAADGQQALDMVQGDSFDLVVLDLHMPFVHGHDIVRALRQPERKRRIPIIVLSGSVGERHSMQSIVLGASVFMPKPPDASALAREVERLLKG